MTTKGVQQGGSSTQGGYGRGGIPKKDSLRTHGKPKKESRTAEMEVAVPHPAAPILKSGSGDTGIGRFFPQFARATAANKSAKSQPHNGARSTCTYEAHAAGTHESPVPSSHATHMVWVDGQNVADIIFEPSW